MNNQENLNHQGKLPLQGEVNALRLVLMGMKDRRSNRIALQKISDTARYAKETLVISS